MYGIRVAEVLKHVHEQAAINLTCPRLAAATIKNTCRFRKTGSNDRLRKSRIDILWGMFYKENVNYPELIWEDIAFQIDHRKEKKSRHETMPFLRFTKVIINHFYAQHKSLFKIKFQHYHIIKDDARKRTVSRRVIKKNVTISAANNIIPDLDIALELGKSISLIEAVEEEAAWKVHAIHARIVTESVPDPSRRRPSCITFRDTSRLLKKVSFDPSQRLKGVQLLTPEEQDVADTMQALKESKNTNRRKPGVLDEEKVTFEENVILEWGSKQESEYFEEDQEMTDDEETKDEFVHDDEQVNDDEDKEMTMVKLKILGMVMQKYLIRTKQMLKRLKK
nr:hypothetical protein [Tanacetum cinerariifolium]